MKPIKNIKKEFREFRTWVLRRHGRRMLNACDDEQVLKLRIREYFQEVKNIQIPANVWGDLEVVANEFPDCDDSGESVGDESGART